MIKRFLLATASWLTLMASGRPEPVAPLTPAPTHVPRRISAAALEAARQAPMGSDARALAFRQLFPLPEPPKGFREAGGIAMDAAIDDCYANAAFDFLGEGLGFLGFPYLAELTQRPEYRIISEIRAEEMTRKGVILKYADQDDKKGQAKVKELEEDLKTFHVLPILRTALEHDGFYGRGQIFIDTGDGENPEELKTALPLKKEKIPKGKLKGFKNIEPLWTYPNGYNAANPLHEYFFRPQTWYVQGSLVHHTRLLTIIGREMPDLLKPAYAFAGMSLSQMAKPYVDNWIRTRQSVSDLVHAFSVMILSTNMGSTIAEGDGGKDLFDRIELFTLNRDNKGFFVVDKETETLTNVAAPITGLKELQAQSQEQMASVSRTPLVKLLGVTPSGLNASSDGEIRVFYDSIASWQEKMLTHPLNAMLQAMQLNRFGEVDPKITFEFVPLWELDEAGEAAVRKTNADTDAVLTGAGVLHPEESRRRLANDPRSGYTGIEVADVPEPPDDPDAEGEPSDGGNPARTAEPRKVEAAGDAAPGWRESDHPRRPDGKFGQGGGGSGPPATQGLFGSAETEHLPPARHVRQPAQSWVEMQEKGEAGRQDFKHALDGVAKRLGLRTDVDLPEHLSGEHQGGFLFIAPNKSKARAEAKVDVDYGGDWSQLKDMIRGSIVVDNIAQLRQAVEAVKASGLELEAKPKDKFAEPTAEGYRDVNTLVRLPNGMVAELQYHVRPIIEAKNKGHSLYEEQQRIVRKNRGEEPTPDWSPEDTAAFHELREAQRSLYGEAWARAS